MRLFLLAAPTVLAFAANSVPNRRAVAPGHSGAVVFAMLRLVGAAVTLAGLVPWQRRGIAWPGLRGLDAGTGALVLFGTVQVTMFTGPLLAREPVPLRRRAGAGGLALAGPSAADPLPQRRGTSCCRCRRWG